MRIGTGELLREAGVADGDVVVAAKARKDTFVVTGHGAGLAGVITVAADGVHAVIKAAVVAEVDGGVVVTAPCDSGQAAAAGERTLVAAAARAVGVVADVDGSVVSASPGASAQVAVTGVSPVGGARGRQVVVADVNGGVVVRASVAGLPAGNGESVGAIGQRVVADAAGRAGVCAAAVGDRQAVLPGGSVRGGRALLDQRIPVE